MNFSKLITLIVAWAVTSIGFAKQQHDFIRSFVAESYKRIESQHPQESEELRPVIDTISEAIRGMSLARGYSSPFEFFSGDKYASSLEILDAIQRTTLDTFDHNSAYIEKAIRSKIITKQNVTSFFESEISFENVSTVYSDELGNNESIFSWEYIWKKISPSTNNTVNNVKTHIEHYGSEDVDEQTFSELTEIIKDKFAQGKKASKDSINVVRRNLQKEATDAANRSAGILCVSSAVALTFDVIEMINVSDALHQSAILRDEVDKELSIILEDVSIFKAELIALARGISSFIAKAKIPSENQKLRIIEKIYDSLNRFDDFQKRYDSLMQKLSIKEKQLIEKRLGSVKRVFSNAFFLAGHMANIYNPHLGKTMKLTATVFAGLNAGVGIYSGYQGYCSHAELQEVRTRHACMHITSRHFARMASEQMKQLIKLKEVLFSGEEDEYDSDIGC